MEKERRKPLPLRLLSFAEDWLFPKEAACLCCERGLGGDDVGLLCESCAAEMAQLCDLQEMRERESDKEALPPGIDFVHAAYAYEGPVRRLVHLLKYENVRDAAALLAGPMAYLPSGEEELIVPIPTDALRQKKRGYNQAALLARHIANTLQMPMEEALWRTRPSRRQTGLPLEQRRQNLVGCMAASDAVNGKRILLVDDVYTSGSTAAEAARALCAAGARSVGVFAAARSGMHDKDYSEPFPLTGFGRKKRKNPVK